MMCPGRRSLSMLITMLMLMPMLTLAGSLGVGFQSQGSLKSVDHVDNPCVRSYACIYQAGEYPETAPATEWYYVRTQKDMLAYCKHLKVLPVFAGTVDEQKSKDRDLKSFSIHEIDEIHPTKVAEWYRLCAARRIEKESHGMHRLSHSDNEYMKVPIVVMGVILPLTMVHKRMCSPLVDAFTFLLVLALHECLGLDNGFTQRVFSLPMLTLAGLAHAFHIFCGSQTVLYWSSKTRKTVLTLCSIGVFLGVSMIPLDPLVFLRAFVIVFRIWKTLNTETDEQMVKHKKYVVSRLDSPVKLALVFYCVTCVLPLIMTQVAMIIVLLIIASNYEFSSIKPIIMTVLALPTPVSSESLVCTGFLSASDRVEPTIVITVVLIAFVIMGTCPGQKAFIATLLVFFEFMKPILVLMFTKLMVPSVETFDLYKEPFGWMYPRILVISAMIAVMPVYLYRDPWSKTSERITMLIIPELLELYLHLYSMWYTYGQYDFALTFSKMVTYHTVPFFTLLTMFSGCLKVYTLLWIKRTAPETNEQKGTGIFVLVVMMGISLLLCALVSAFDLHSAPWTMFTYGFLRRSVDWWESMIATTLIYGLDMNPILMFILCTLVPCMMLAFGLLYEACGLNGLSWSEKCNNLEVKNKTLEQKLVVSEQRIAATVAELNFTKTFMGSLHINPPVNNNALAGTRFLELGNDPSFSYQPTDSSSSNSNSNSTTETTPAIKGCVAEAADTAADTDDTANNTTDNTTNDTTDNTTTTTANTDMADTMQDESGQ